MYDKLGNIKMCRHHHVQSIEYSVTDTFKAFAIINLVNLDVKSQPYPTRPQLIALEIMLKEARVLNPLDATVEFTMGLVHEMMGLPHSAMHHFEQALAKDPNYSLALLNVGNQYFKRNDFTSAADFYEQAIGSMDENDHNLLQAHSNLGQSLRERGLLNLALNSFRNAYKIVDAEDFSWERRFSLDSASELLAVSHLITVHTMLCRWQYLELWEHLVAQYLHALDREVDNRALRYEDGYGLTLSQAVDPYSVMLFRHGTVRTDLTASRVVCGTQPHAFQSDESEPTRTLIASDSLRVGYLSVDWRDHPMGRLTTRLVISHNHSRVSAECFSYGPDDNSLLRREVQIGSGCKFHDLERVHSPLDAAQMVSEASLNIVVDLTTHTFNGRIDIAALKPAPIVINYLGFPGTSGCAGFDFALVDRVVAPPEWATQAFSERLVYLPYSYQANNMPMEVAPCGKDRAACRRERRLITKSTLISHLQDSYDEQWYYLDSTRWLCSFNANKKMEPVSFGAWMNVLLRVPSAVLVLLDVTVDTRVEIVAATVYHGVSSRRVLFVAKETWHRHLYRSAACDLVLDTFVYGAHTTAADMLWMHVPVLALQSFGAGRMPSRVAGSLIKSLQSTDPDPVHKFHSDVLGLLVVSSVRVYEDTAVRILRRLHSVGALHQALAFRNMRSHTFDSEAMQRDVECVYQSVHELLKLNEATAPNAQLPHVVITTTTRERNESAIHMLREAHRVFLLEIESMKDALEMELRNCIHSVDVSDFSIALQQLADCSAAEAKNTNKVDIWRGVSGVVLRLLNAVTAESHEAFSLHRVIAFISHFEEANTEVTDLKIVDVVHVDIDLSLSSSTSAVTVLFHSQSVMTAESLQQDVRMIHTQRASQEDTVRLVDRLRDILRLYLEQDRSVMLEILLHTQQNLLADCEVAQLLFDVMQPLLFSVNNYEDFMAVSLSHDSHVASALFAHGDAVTAVAEAISPLDVANVAHSIKWRSVTPSVANVLLAHMLLHRLVPLSHKEQFTRMESSFMPLSHSDPGSNNDALAQLLFMHASVLNKERLSSDLHGLRYAMVTLSALRLSLSLEQLRNVGIALMDCGLSEIGHLMASVAVLKMHQARYVSLPSEVSTFRAVSFYCDEYGQSWWPGWGPSAISQEGRGMGGSEEAVWYLAVELARLGYEVTIYAEIPQTDVGVIMEQQADGSGRIRWMHCSHFDVDNPQGVFVAWRYSMSVLLGAAFKTSYLWLHDLVSGCILPPSLFTQCSGLLVQSDFHKDYTKQAFSDAHTDMFDSAEKTQLMHQQLDANIIVTPNGLVISDYEAFTFTNNNHIFIYGSAPNRGLDLVLQSWSDIKRRIPDAILEVYYGFTDAVQRHMRSALGDQGYQVWFDRMDLLLQQDGVQYFGAVDHSRLMQAYQRAGFLLYPTTFQETGCITALRAMAAGAIPITSRLRESVLFSLTREFDMGPEIALDLRVVSNKEHLEMWLRDEWIESVVRASQIDESVLYAHRVRMSTAIRQQWSWKNTAQGLDKAFTELFQ